MHIPLDHIDTQFLQHRAIFLVSVAVFVLILNFILKRLFNRLSQNTKIKKLELPKVHLILQALGKPLRIYLWMLIAFYLIYFVAIDILGFAYDDWFAKFVTILSFAMVLWISLRFIKGVELFYIKRLPKKTANLSFEISGIKALSRLGQVTALLIFVLIILGVLQIPLSGLITVGGVGGIAIAYAGKDILSNFLGGVMIYLNRQFSIGDSISSPDRDIAGTIEEMGWRYTTIRRNDKQVMYVPNSIFSEVLLVNMSRMSHRILTQTLGLRYEDITKIPAIFADLHAYLDQHPDIDQVQGVQINITQFAASSINFTVTIYSSVTDKLPFYQLQDAILLKTTEIVTKHGAEFAFPTMTIDLPQGFKK